ncbi:tetratricopeptide repeat protein [Gigaspora margarita]|uniref:Tetratricopeptide repeat protein n=1 Tax=Gigaspora margarita TaxID=4874 RepID=A0A8H4EPV5_GIGMA|nr:tetratricopeptide repeat protein [Gigaspora margarita]
MKEDYVSALSDFEKVLKSSNSTQNLRNQCIGYRGAVQFKLGLKSEQNRSELFEQSRSNLENAIELKPKEPYWHCQLGALLYKQGDHDNSLKELTEAIELFKYSPLLLETKFRKVLMSEAYNYRGLLYEAKGDSRMANSDFKEYHNLIQIM